MPDAITCSCGYRGPAVAVAGRNACPICRTPSAAPSGDSLGSPAATSAHRPPTAAGTSSAQPTVHRIPCPRGHVLKAGEHMLGQQVVCPECNELFLLRKEDSLENRRKREQAQRAEDERVAKLWLSRAILAAAFIVASLVGMITLSFAFRPPLPPRPAEPPSDQAPAAQTE